jgi:hypothetical protein
VSIRGYNWVGDITVADGGFSFFVGYF